MKLSWGIIGLGQLANEWVAPAIRDSNNGQLVACADSVVERADQFGSFHGIDHVYYSYEKLIEDPRVEAVYVATPNALHHPIVLAAARGPQACPLPKADGIHGKGSRGNAKRLRWGGYYAPDRTPFTIPKNTSGFLGLYKARFHRDCPGGFRSTLCAPS